MRASTVRSRFLDRCGHSLGVEISFKDICILAAVLNSTCRSKFGPYVRASLRGAVMGLFRDSRDRRDLSLKVCWTLAVWLMTQQLRCDVNEADEADESNSSARSNVHRSSAQPWISGLRSVVAWRPLVFKLGPWL